MFQKRIHVFKSGDQTSAQGVQRHFSDRDLQQVVDTYDPSIHEAPLVIGHAGDNDSLPAYGWIKGFSKQGGNLYADVAFTDTAKDLVKNGHYRKVSISFYSPDSAINPHKGKWSARHLALLGASPPAVKGLEPFTFAEMDGVYDFAVALAPSDIFDEELGPTLIVEKSPLEMLKEKLDEVRQDVSSAVKELQGNQQSQPSEELVDVAASSVTEQPEAAQMANPDAPQFKETNKHVGREGTEIAQQTADLETQFPEEEFMEPGKISRKHAKGAHGQVMQVVENVYDEAHKESTAERKAAADRAFEAKRMRKEGRDEEAREVAHYGKEEDKLLSKDHKESTAERKAAADRGREATRQREEGKDRLARETERIAKQEDKLISEDHKEKQGYNDRLDESLGARNGKKSQSMKDRRDESKGMEKAMGKRPYSGDKSMDQQHKEGYNARLDESLGDRDGKESGKKQSLAARRHESEGMEKASGKRKYSGDKSMDHSELEYDEVSYKTAKNGKVHFGYRDEEDGGDEGRYDTARSDSDGYVDRMRTGKAGRDGRTGRMETARSSEQDRDRMHTAKSGEQQEDRMHTGRASEDDGDGFSRWAGQEDGYDQVDNMDQYDAGFDDYPEPNHAQLSKGTDPYGRKESATRIPVETEEGPDDTIFAVQMTNVMSDKDMRVLRQKSSDKRAKAVKTHDYLYGEPQADEMTTEDGVTTARKSMNARRTVEHAEYETDEPDHEADLEDLRYEIGDGRKSKNRLLTPGAQDSLFDPAAIVGPDGAYAEIPEGEYKSYKGEPKSKNRQLVPGAMDTVTDPAEITGPDGAYKEASLEQLREEIGDGKKSKARQLQPGAMDDLDTPAEVSKRSGGVYAEEHAEGKKDPYTKTGFGSTYEEGEGDSGVDEGEETYGEYSVDHCGYSDHLSNVSPMGNEYGTMGSMHQARPLGIREMAEELANLKQKYAELENRNRMEKMNFRRMQMAEAIGHLYTEGRMTDGVMPEQELLSYVEGLEFGTLEFSEGETAATKLLALLSKLPPMVSFGEVAGGTFQYAEEDLDPHAKALKMVEESEGKMDYVEALKKTMFQG